MSLVVVADAETAEATEAESRRRRLRAAQQRTRVRQINQMFSLGMKSKFL